MNNEIQQVAVQTTTDETTKVAYTKPVLVCHGTIAEIVQRAGAAGSADGGFFAS